MAAPRGLHRLARLHGIQTAYHGNDGRRIQADPESLMAALRALRVPVSDAASVPRLADHRRRQLWERVVEPVIVTWLPGRDASFAVRLSAGDRARHVRVLVDLESGGERTAEVELEELEVLETGAVDGREYVARAVPLPDVPAGYHDLRLEVAAGPRRSVFRALLIAAPREAAGWEVLPGGPAWGVFAPLYALWGEDGQAPHFGHLDRLAGSVARAGGAVVGTLPLLAAYLDEPYEPSPYAPVSRLFWNELYVLPGSGDAGERARAAPAPAPLRKPFVEHRRLMAERRRALESEARAFFGEPEESDDERWQPERRPELAAFRARNPGAWDYARFRALVEAHGSWRRWPERLRARDVRPGDYDPDVARYHLYAQWQAERQLAAAEERAASRGTSLYLDLPLGVHPAGYDVWRQRALFALGARAGAPPDPLSERGQDWGFHPPHPEAGRLDGHRYFIASIRHHLRFASVLRIDHVMQLHRLFWVVGDDARTGVYVRYPAEELYAILCLESHRAGAVIVGEDLGTVPRAVRRGMRRHGLPGMYVVEFELEDTTEEGRPALAPREIPPGSLASIGTHDTPTFAAWWTGRDAGIRGERGLADEEEVRTEMEGRSALREKLARGLGLTGADGPDREAALRVQRSLLGRLGASRAGLVLAALEDLWLETEPQNVPGTTDETNWRRRARRPLEALQDPDVAALLDTLNEARKGTDE